MLLGKRLRPRMRRTTSMTEFAGDFAISDVEAIHPSAEQVKLLGSLHHQPNPLGDPQQVSGAGDWLATRYQGSPTLSQRSGRHRRNSGDFAVVETAPFLRTCGLCNRRLGPGRDIFMYRGYAFCSLECRQRHMKQDERQKCNLTSIKEAVPATNSSEHPADSGVAAALAYLGGKANQAIDF